MEFDVVETRDRERIERALRRQAGAHVYALADLDDAHFAATRWFAAVAGGEIAALCMLFERLSPTVLYAVCAPGDPAVRALLERIGERLPAHCFLNLGLGLESALPPGELVGVAEYEKMLLVEPARADAVDGAGIVELGPDAAEELAAFYASEASAPGEADARFFAPYMLEAAPYLGVREGGRLVAVAGVHVLSARYRVAALGNVATRPDRRRRGLARATTAAQCRRLRGRVSHLGLNVAVSNAAARRCYEALGFRGVCRYLEGHLHRR
jgi:ribosomal protein S18 acetylase RimI-like enzyme